MNKIIYGAILVACAASSLATLVSTAEELLPDIKSLQAVSYTEPLSQGERDELVAFVKMLKSIQVL